MLPHWFSATAVATAIAGPVSHYGIWIHGEWDGRFHRLVPSISLAQLLMLCLLYWSGHGLIPSVGILSLLNISYVMPLFLSITVYRLFLHPTRLYQGPFWARLSAWWRVNAFLNGDQRAYAVTDDLHQRYGDIVRAGTYLPSIASLVLAC